MMSCLIPRDVVTIIDTWDVAGMRGTGSQTYAVTETFVRVRPRCLGSVASPPCQRKKGKERPFPFYRLLAASPQ